MVAALKVSTDARLQRFIRISVASVLLACTWFYFSAILASPDVIVFQEILKGFADLWATKSLDDPVTMQQSVSAAMAGLPNICFAFGLLPFSLASVWTGYKLQTAGRIVVGMQLCLVSTIYCWVCWQLFTAVGRPVSLYAAVVFGCVVGWRLKLRDDERRLLDAKNIELKLRNQELQTSKLAMVKQDEAERRLLAADLHDQILNDLRTVAKKFEQYAGDPDAETAKQITAQLKQSMNDIREIMDDLCPVMLEEFGLAAAIEDRLDKAAKTNKLSVRLNDSTGEGDLKDLSAVEVQLIYRLVQESITNICKHAEAKTVKVSMQRDGQELVIGVLDDGKGIDPDKLSASSRGTLYMRLRASLIDASINWKSAPSGKGTLVEIKKTMTEPASNR